MYIRARGKQMLMLRYESYDAATKYQHVPLIATADLKTFTLKMREKVDAPGEFYEFTSTEKREFLSGIIRIKKEMAAKAQAKLEEYSMQAINLQTESLRAAEAAPANEAAALIDDAFEVLHAVAALDPVLLADLAERRAVAHDSGELWLAINALTRALTRAGHPKPRRSYKTASTPQQTLDI